MKKVLSVLLALAMVCALSVVVYADGTATATGSFVCTFTDNDYDTNVATMTGVAADGTWGGCFPIITEIIEKVAPLSQVTSIEVTVKASNTDACSKGVTPKVELHWNTRDGENAMTADFVDGVAVVSGDLPAGTTAVVLNPYAFASEAGEITFEVSVAVTYTGEGNAPAEDTSAPAEDTAAPAEDATAPAEDTTAPAETTTPADTGIVLAVLPMAMAAAALVFAKRK